MTRNLDLFGVGAPGSFIVFCHHNWFSGRSKIEDEDEFEDDGRDRRYPSGIEEPGCRLTGGSAKPDLNYSSSLIS
jgi:hypothetical protein